MSAVVALLSIAVLVAALWAGRTVERNQCAQRYAAHEWHYSVANGCQIKRDGRWTHAENGSVDCEPRPEQ